MKRGNKPKNELKKTKVSGFGGLPNMGIKLTEELIIIVFSETICIYTILI